eukprot:gene203-36_t
MDDEIFASQGASPPERAAAGADGAPPLLSPARAYPVGSTEEVGGGWRPASSSTDSNDHDYATDLPVAGSGNKSGIDIMALGGASSLAGESNAAGSKKSAVVASPPPHGDGAWNRLSATREAEGGLPMFGGGEDGGEDQSCETTARVGEASGGAAAGAGARGGQGEQHVGGADGDVHAHAGGNVFSDVNSGGFPNQSNAGHDNAATSNHGGPGSPCWPGADVSPDRNYCGHHGGGNTIGAMNEGGLTPAPLTPGQQQHVSNCGDVSGINDVSNIQSVIEYGGEAGLRDANFYPGGSHWEGGGTAGAPDHGGGLTLHNVTNQAGGDGSFGAFGAGADESLGAAERPVDPAGLELPRDLGLWVALMRNPKQRRARLLRKAQKWICILSQSALGTMQQEQTALEQALAAKRRQQQDLHAQAADSAGAHREALRRAVDELTALRGEIAQQQHECGRLRADCCSEEERLKEALVREQETFRAQLLARQAELAGQQQHLSTLKTTYAAEAERLRRERAKLLQRREEVDHKAFTDLGKKATGGIQINFGGAHGRGELGALLQVDSGNAALADFDIFSADAKFYGEAVLQKQRDAIKQEIISQSSLLDEYVAVEKETEKYRGKLNRREVLIPQLQKQVEDQCAKLNEVQVQKSPANELVAMIDLLQQEQQQLQHQIAEEADFATRAAGKEGELVLENNRLARQFAEAVEELNALQQRNAAAAAAETAHWAGSAPELVSSEGGGWPHSHGAESPDHGPLTTDQDVEMMASRDGADTGAGFSSAGFGAGFGGGASFGTPGGVDGLFGFEGVTTPNGGGLFDAGGRAAERGRVGPGAVLGQSQRVWGEGHHQRAQSSPYCSSNSMPVAVSGAYPPVGGGRSPAAAGATEGNGDGVVTVEVHSGGKGDKMLGEPPGGNGNLPSDGTDCVQQHGDDRGDLANGSSNVETVTGLLLGPPAGQAARDDEGGEPQRTPTTQTRRGASGTGSSDGKGIHVHNVTSSRGAQPQAGPQSTPRRGGALLPAVPPRQPHHSSAGGGTPVNYGKPPTPHHYPSGRKSSTAQMMTTGHGSLKKANNTNSQMNTSIASATGHQMVGNSNGSNRAASANRNSNDSRPTAGGALPGTRAGGAAPHNLISNVYYGRGIRGSSGRRGASYQPVLHKKQGGSRLPPTEDGGSSNPGSPEKRSVASPSLRLAAKAGNASHQCANKNYVNITTQRKSVNSESACYDNVNGDSPALSAQSGERPRSAMGCAGASPKGAPGHMELRFLEKQEKFARLQAARNEMGAPAILRAFPRTGGGAAARARSLDPPR